MRLNTGEEACPAADEGKSPCQIQTSHEQDQRKRTDMPSTRMNSTRSKDGTGSAKEEEILSWSGSEETEVDNKEFQSVSVVDLSPFSYNHCKD